MVIERIRLFSSPTSTLPAIMSDAWRAKQDEEREEEEELDDTVSPVYDPQTANLTSLGL
jgi:hypothetical protein